MNRSLASNSRSSFTFMGFLLLLCLFFLSSSPASGQTLSLQHSRYIGCVDLISTGWQAFHSGSWSPAECRNRAFTRTHEFFAMSKGDECYTEPFNRTGRFTFVSNSNCDQECDKDSNRNCGSSGGQFFSLWQINLGPTVTRVVNLNLPPVSAAGGRAITLIGSGFTGLPNSGALIAPIVTITQPESIYQSLGLQNPTADCPVTGWSDTSIVCTMPNFFGNPLIQVRANNLQQQQLPRWKLDLTWYTLDYAVSTHSLCLNVTQQNGNPTTQHLCVNTNSKANLRWRWSINGPISGMKCTPISIPGWSTVNLCLPQSSPYDLTFYADTASVPGWQVEYCLPLSGIAGGQSVPQICSQPDQPLLNMGGGSIGPFLRYVFQDPIIDSISPSAGSVAGGTVITVTGRNFGVLAAGAASRFTINGQDCVIVTASWSDTSFQCTAPPGEGKLPDLSLTIVDVVVSYPASSLWSYAAPSISTTTPSTGNTIGGYEVTLAGSNFGPTRGTVEILLPNPLPTRLCSVTSWSNTSIRVSLPAGTGGNLQFRVTTLATLNGQAVVQSPKSIQINSGSFSYFAPQITSVNPSVAPTAGSLITISGNQFGTSFGAVSSLTVGGQSCQITSQIVTESQIICQMVKSCDSLAALSLTISGQSNQPFIIPLATHSVSGVSANNGQLQFSGINFCDGSSFPALFSPTPNSFPTQLQAFIGNHSCRVSSAVWLDSSVTCLPDVNANLWGYNVISYVRRGVLDNINQARSSSHFYQYPPKIEMMNSSFGAGIQTIPGSAPRYPTQGNYWAVLAVRSLPDARFAGSFLSRVTVRIDGVLTTINRFVMPSTISSLGSSASAGLLNITIPPATTISPVVLVTVDSLQDSITFSYDMPFIESISPSPIPIREGSFFTITGRNFGSLTSRVSIRVGQPISGINCIDTFVNHTTIICQYNGGSGANQPIQVTLDSTQQSNEFFVDFDAPVLNWISPRTGIVDGGFPVFFTGRNFAPTAITVFFSGAPITPVNLINSTYGSFVCPAGFGSASVQLSVNSRVSNILTLTYAGPIVFSVSPTVADTSARSGNNPVVLTILGQNFSPTGSTITVGPYNCPLSLASPSSSTVLYCSLAVGSGVDHSVIVTVGASSSNVNVKFGYSKPYGVQISPSTGSTDGLNVNIFGRSFDLDGIVKIGPYDCTPISPGAWTHNQITCALTAGEGTNLPVVVNVTSTKLASNETVFFSYDPPVISSVAPSNLPSTGGIPITVQGSNFGLTAAVFFNGRPCNRTATPQTTRSIECMLPAGQGTGNRVSLIVGNQTSNLFAVNYAPPVVTAVFPLNGPTDGTTRITMLGRNFGTTPFILIGGRNASIVSSNDTAIIMISPRNSGRARQIFINAAGQTANAGAFDYDAPVINSVDSTACDRSPPSISNCPVGGGSSITINGRNFGDMSVMYGNLIVQIGSRAIASYFPINVTVTLRTDTQIVFTLPQLRNGGFNLPVTTILDAQSDSEALLSYSGPLVSSINMTPLTTTTIVNRGSWKEIVLNSTYGFPTPDRVVTINGRFFGSNFSAVQIKYDRSCISSPAALTANCPQDISQQFNLRRFTCSLLSLISDTQLTCRLQEGSGANLTFVVQVDVQYSIESMDAISYPPPRIMNNSLALYVSSNIIKSSSVIGVSSLGDQLQFDVDNVGGRAADLQISMSNGRFTVQCSLLDFDTVATPRTVRCQTPQGYDEGYRFTVIANGQPSRPSNDIYQYAAPPIVSQVIGVRNVPPDTFDNPTTGGVTPITILGDKFGFVDLSVSIGELQCLSPAFESINKVTCIVPPQTGLSLPVIVGVSNRFSAPAYSLSYALPTVIGVSGCEDIFNSTVGGTQYTLLTRNCTRLGGSMITLRGDSFGPDSKPPTVIVGGELCRNVRVVDPNQKVATCAAPRGNALNQPVIFLQSSGPLTIAMGQVSYRQCEPGTWATTSDFVCMGTPPGTFTDTDGLTAPKPCLDGFFSRANATTCTACSVGTSSRVGASICSQCAAGRFNGATNQADCQDCPAGRFANRTGMSACDLCTPGTFSASTGASACTRCVAGTFSSSLGVTSCSPCDPGYVSGSGNSTCLPCPAGSQENGQRTFCDLCPPGTRSDSIATTRCADCVPGTFQFRFGQLSCDACPAGSFSNSVRSDVCQPCLPGRYSNTPGQSVCTSCEQGKFDALNGGASNCVACAAGRFTNTIGQLNCTRCPPGSAAPAVGSVACSLCAPGFIASRNGTQICSACSPGTFAPRVGLSACLQCPPGQFSQTAQVICSECAEGFYQNASSSSFCYSCPPGTEGPQIAAIQIPVLDPNTGSNLQVSVTGRSTCRGCDVGKFASNIAQARCNPCDRGFFQSRGNQTACTLCPAGTAASQRGASSCDICVGGFYSDRPGLSTCIYCEPGRFQASSSQQSCSDCPVGRFSPGSTLSIPATTCQDCTAGTFALIVGQSGCGQCAAGKFSGPASRNCTDCLPGFFSAQSGSPSCSIVQPGFFVSSVGSSKQFECAPGYFSVGTGSTGCRSCQPGYQNPSFRATSCSPCSPGQISAGAAAIQCDACPAGTFAPANASVCTPCGQGTFAAVPGLSTCLDCPIGTQNALQGQKRCFQCPAGKYVNYTSATTCFDCPAGKFSSFGSALCTDCPIGFYSASPSQADCRPCPTGQFMNETGKTECFSCPAGSFQLSEGSGGCDLCPLGRYADAPNNAYCLPCPAGFYSNVTGLTLCGSCEPGTAQDAEASTSCDLCKPGFFTRAARTPACQQCPKGRYAPDFGYSDCLFCTPGTYGSVRGLTLCVSCGVGKFASGFGTDTPDCEACAPGRYTDVNGTAVCPFCTAGRFATYPASSFCSICQPGRYSGGGTTSCPKCGEGSLAAEVAPDAGMSSCIACSVPSVADPFNIDCRCPVGFAARPANFSEDRSATNQQCFSCPEGAVCDITGVQWNTMEAQRGWWRTPYVARTAPEYQRCVSDGRCGFPLSLNERPLFYRCIDLTLCNGGLNTAYDLFEVSEANTCPGNRVGPMCELCAIGYTEQLGRICVPCTSEGANITIVIFICIALSFALMLMYYVLLKSNSIFYLASAEAERRKDAEKEKAVVEREKDFASIYHMDIGLQEEQPGMTIGGTSGPLNVTALFENEREDDELARIALHRFDHNISLTGAPSAKPNFTNKLKIALSFAQIVTNSAINLDIPWPSHFSQFMSWLNPVNLDFVKVSNIGCVVDNSFYNKFNLVVGLPPLVLLALLCGFWLPLTIKAGFNRIERKLVRQKSWLLFLYTLFLIYPFVSSTIMATFVCRKIGDQTYLVADKRQYCYTDIWYRYVYAAAILIPIYPLGIPGLFLYMLTRYRDRMSEAGVRAELGFLYDAYATSRWWFELLDLGHKFFITSLLLLFPREGMLPTALVVTGVYFACISVFKPYVRKSDDRLHIIGQCELILLFMAGNNFSQEGNYSNLYDILLSVILIFLVGSYFIFFGAQAYGALRRWRREYGKLEIKLQGAKKAEVELEVMPAALKTTAIGIDGQIIETAIEQPRKGTSAEKLLNKPANALDEDIEKAFVAGRLNNSNLRHIAATAKAAAGGSVVVDYSQGQGGEGDYSALSPSGEGQQGEPEQRSSFAMMQQQRKSVLQHRLHAIDEKNQDDDAW